ncbi:MAG: peptide chain release factor N(5)-glutamine methyltransferase [Chloroflexi bacterium]|nr:peptide chain release factor N(5)-glutamine methyltransferase [Chloroflexota bacterium]
MRPDQSVGGLTRILTGELTAAGVPEARLVVDLLLGHILGWSRAQLFGHPERALAPPELTSLRQLVERAKAREPVAYLLGHREFYGLDLEVTSAVLIPRPETELLVELALDWAGELAARVVVDVGTGSGAIALAVAAKAPELRVIAVDVSAAALEVARRNAGRLQLLDRVDFRLGDLLEPVDEQVDLVLANLPYVSDDEVGVLAPEIRDYEPRLALAAGADGLGLYRRLGEQAPSRLRSGGAVICEIAASQATSAPALAREIFPSAHVETRQDLAGLTRIVGVRFPLA